MFLTLPATSIDAPVVASIVFTVVPSSVAIGALAFIVVTLVEPATFVAVLASNALIDAADSITT